MPVLAAGSRVRVGFSVNTEYFSTDYDSIKGDVEGCLYNTGQFDWIEIFVKKGNVFERDYFLVTAVTALDFGNTEDFGGLVAQQIVDCAPDIHISARDPVQVDAVPQAVVGQQGVQQVNNAEGQGPTRQPGQCDNLGFFDYLSCQTGLNKSTVGIGLPVIAIGGLVVLAIFLRR